MSGAGNHQRIARNTLMLYLRQVLILAVSLYTVRVVLNTLGVDDYGIYNVVAGIVSFFSFLSGTMASATQRYFAYALGQQDHAQLKRIFVVNTAVYAGIAVLALFLLETAGLWFVHERLKIPPDRLVAVAWVYQYSILTFLVTILATPFMAILIAHEDMQVYAYVSVFEAVLKLATVFALAILPGDKLPLYGLLLLLSSCATLFLYVRHCLRHYDECRFGLRSWDTGLFREIIAFTGWTLFGQVSTVARNQAITILLNQVFNPAVVAARAIAVNISNQVGLFSNNFNVGLYPSIIKTYAAGDRDAMNDLVSKGSRITFYLLWIFALPLLVGMDTILRLWLGSPPAQAVLFTRLALVETLVMSVSLPITTAARAPGKMRLYELSLGSIQLAIFGASWLALHFGQPASSVFVVAIAANVAMFALRLLLVRRLVGLPIGRFLRKVGGPVAVVTVSSSLVAAAVSSQAPDHDGFRVVAMAASFAAACSACYVWGLERSERSKLNTVLRERIGKVFGT